MGYGSTKDVTETELAEFFLNNLYGIVIDKYPKEEIYDRIGELEKLLSKLLKQMVVFKISTDG